MKKKLALLVLLFSLISPLLWAQKAPVKFGKIDAAFVKMTTHSLDTSASAVILVDYGSTDFRYSDDSGFIFQFDRIMRIKVLKKDGLEFGDFEIPYYHNNSDKEKVTNVKGYTYNYVKGSVEKNKLEKSSIFDEETNNNWNQVKVSMPNVKVGSVIELKYTLVSPFIWNLTTWEFQSTVPTVYSEYRVSIPEYFDYQLLFSGYHPLVLNDESEGKRSITYTVKDEIPAGTTHKVQEYSNTIDYKIFNKRWAAKNVPAFKLEPYVASPNDYLSKIKFELRGTRYPNQPYNAYMGTWESLTTTFLDDNEFGEAIKHTGYMKAELDQIAELKSDEDKIVALVSLVRNQIEWNHRYSRYASTTLRKAWVDKKGSTGDINLMIVAGLKKLGFEADPVLISTRGHGMIRKQYAISNQFNSVIALVKFQNKTVLLDGTDRYLPVGVLPKNCLNEKGWRVSESSAGWISIKPTNKQERVFQASFEIESNGEITGELELSEKGYAGFSSNKKLKLSGEEKYFEDFQNRNSDWIIDDYEYEKGTSYSDPFKSKYTIEFTDKTVASADILYFNPTLNEVLNENPFKLEDRVYPVDFAYPIKSLFMLKFHLPEGYSINELPKSTAFALPNNAARFTYNVSSFGDSVQIMADFQINKTMFVQSEYPALKQFYDLVVQKCAEQVVLKKTSH